MLRLPVRGPAGACWISLIILLSGCSVPPKTPLPTHAYRGITRVACVGDSITAGSGLADPSQDSYPAVLARRLGSAYDVRNFGISGATVLREGDHPYLPSDAMEAARAFRPQVVVIALGTNDSKPHNWRYHEAFERDAYSLARAFLQLPTRPTVYLCTPPPVFQDRWGINEATVAREIAPILRRMCAREGWPLIDLHTHLYSAADEFPDGVHPDATGAARVAYHVEAAFRGR